MHSRLPVDSLFQRQGTALVSQCPFCVRFSESLEHLFEDCLFACGLWSSLAALFGLGALPRSPLALFNCVRKSRMSSQLKGIWQVGFFEAILMIWRTRNKVRHGERIPYLHFATRQLALAIVKARVFWIGTMENTIHDLITLRQLGVTRIPRRAQQIIPIIWYPPPAGFVNINVDGSAQNSRTEVGGVFRLADRRVLAAFSAWLDSCSAFKEEAHGCL